MEDFKKQGGTLAQEQIVNAKTRTQLETAYISYATKLRGLSGEIERTEAPTACEDFKEEAVRFVDDLGHTTEQIADQKHMTESRLLKLAKQENSPSKKFSQKVESLEEGGSCG